MDTRSPETPAPPAAVTPMMAQYIEIKAANPDCLLFYRMGDFYEMFFEDAEVASGALGITLTKRGKHAGDDIPMCGVPVHAADQYLQKLIALGYRVAVCEQTEDPAEAKKRGGKSVVRRDVVRLVTPGTITEDTLLAPGRNNYLAAVSRQRGAGADGGDGFGLAWIDISTGEFRVAASDAGRFAADLARVAPSEVLVAEPVFADPDLNAFWRGLPMAVTPLSPAFFDGATAESRLTGYFAVRTLDGFGAFSRAELPAAAAALAYVEKTQIGERPPLMPPAAEATDGVMLIDAATRANLELTATLSGDRRGSLLAAIDRTVTGAGARLLAQRLAGPATDAGDIAGRLDAVAWMLADTGLRHVIREDLAAAPDIARALSRVTLGRGGPRDLAAIRDGLEAATRIAGRIGSGDHPPVVAAAAGVLATAPQGLAEALANALADDLPHLRRDGGFVRDGHHDDLDEARKLRDESRRVIAGLQADYAAETDIRALKIKHNNVLGYFVEVNAAHGERLMKPPLNARFIHRQTMANAVRFTTTALADLEAKIAGAGERALAIELAVFDELAAAVEQAGAALRAIADALAILDVAAASAVLAEAEDYCRPVVEESLAFSIEGGRHPVVEQALRHESQSFVANDCALGPDEAGDAGHIWLVTGPNMAGKSTFLRQNALIAIMAQIGCYVPARAARIGIVDRLFSRVGAADDLARGRSTFMVEMVETAAILNQAGPRSLVILDEIGRGTATFDGLSIAWAAIEHLHEVNRSRALFATHYHELTALSERLARLRNVTVRVKEWQGDVIFLHEIAAGAADRSYGIQVAKLAGLPASVVERARAVLAQLEETDRKSPVNTLIDDLPLFSAARTAGPTEAVADPVAAMLETIRPDDLSPREALEALYRLKAALREKRGD
ncbi:DNA mismatch repair protein MutS [Bauldia litoralis]|uniref:DNA mismatch repair protein MutS n=1 Tax=Bauldia litoralis TaxID=665467 RepID=UPI003298620E